MVCDAYKWKVPIKYIFTKAAGNSRKAGQLSLAPFSLSQFLLCSWRFIYCLQVHMAERLTGNFLGLNPSSAKPPVWLYVISNASVSASENGVKWVNTVKVLRQVRKMCPGTDSAQRWHHRELPINLGKFTLLFLVMSLLFCQFFTNLLFLCPKDLKAPCSGRFLVSSFSCEDSHTHTNLIKCACFSPVNLTLSL